MKEKVGESFLHSDWRCVCFAVHQFCCILQKVCTCVFYIQFKFDEIPSIRYLVTCMAEEGNQTDGRADGQRQTSAFSKGYYYSYNQVNVHMFAQAVSRLI